MSKRNRPQSDHDLSGFPDNIYVSDNISRRYKRYSVTSKERQFYTRFLHTREKRSKK